MSALHADALATLRSWPAPDHDQERLRQRYLAHLEAHPTGLDRGCRPDHVTASTLVLSSDHSQVLLTLHAKAERWFQFGGHCELGDLRLRDAATREAREESGLAGLSLDPVPVQLSEHAVPFCRDPGAPPPSSAAPSGSTVDPAMGPAMGPANGPAIVHHLDVRFLAVVPADAVPSVSEESLDVRWWPVSELPEPDLDLVDLVRLGITRAETRVLEVSRRTPRAE
ncbi:MAG: NUDIX domain-containing protein [Nocardioides sp.]